ncbi:epoxyqueuosine reductase QueH [Spirochaetota bacterium]
MKSLLLHTCCAPCTSYVYRLLSEDYNVTCFFYNPNIAPALEYNKRLDELLRYSKEAGFPVIAGDYDARQWTLSAKKYRHLGERSARCFECYRYRLEATFREAVMAGADIVTTSLSISPLKDAKMINKIGKELQEEFGIEFMEADFKKKDGYKKSVELSKSHGFYRQNYCGCIYSKMERG